jgi:hypothetical protein
MSLGISSTMMVRATPPAEPSIVDQLSLTIDRLAAAR